MPASLPPVLVLGASGRFGLAAVHAFAAAGHPVLAQSRSLPAGLPADHYAKILPGGETHIVRLGMHQLQFPFLPVEWALDLGLWVVLWTQSGLRTQAVSGFRAQDHRDFARRDRS